MTWDTRFLINKYLRCTFLVHCYTFFYLRYTDTSNKVLIYITLTLWNTILSCTSFSIPQKTCISRSNCTAILEMEKQDCHEQVIFLVETWFNINFCFFRQKIDIHWKDTFRGDIQTVVIFIVIFAQNLSRLLVNWRLVSVGLLSFYSRVSKIVRFLAKVEHNVCFIKIQTTVHT